MGKELEDIMWLFLVKVLEFLENVKWKKLWRDITNMPRGLKITLMFSLFVGITYFTYLKSTTSYNISTLQYNVKELNKKVNKTVTDDNYRAHFVQFVKLLQILETLQYYYYQQNQLSLRVWRRSLSHNHPNDPLIYDVDAMINRNQTEYTIMFNDYRNAMKLLGINIPVRNLEETDAMNNRSTTDTFGNNKSYPTY